MFKEIHKNFIQTYYYTFVIIIRNRVNKKYM